MASDFSQEQEYGITLNTARAQRSEILAIEEASKQIQKPSSRKYHRMMTLAITLDVLDWLELTLVGIIITYALKIIFTPVLYFYGRNANTHIKGMADVKEILEEKISHIRRKMYSYINRYKFATKMIRKSARLGRHLAKFEGSAKKIGQSITRLPGLRNLWMIIADYVPILDLLPWRTLGVYLTYRDELKTFNETQPTLEEYQETTQEEFALQEETDEEEAVQEFESAV
jgi:hypothetical protein